MSRPFDYVDWSRAGVERRRLDVAQFMALPLRMRVHGIINNEFTFVDRGKTLPAHEALDRIAKNAAQ